MEELYHIQYSEDQSKKKRRRNCNQQDEKLSPYEKVVRMNFTIWKYKMRQFLVGRDIEWHRWQLGGHIKSKEHRLRWISIRNKLCGVLPRIMNAWSHLAMYKSDDIEGSMVKSMWKIALLELLKIIFDLVYAWLSLFQKCASEKQPSQEFSPISIYSTYTLISTWILSLITQGNK